MSVEKLARRLTHTLLGRLRDYTLNEDREVRYVLANGERCVEYFSEGAQDVVCYHHPSGGRLFWPDRPSLMKSDTLFFETIPDVASFVPGQMIALFATAGRAQLETYLAHPVPEESYQAFCDDSQVPSERCFELWTETENAVFQTVGPLLHFPPHVLKEMLDS